MKQFLVALLIGLSVISYSQKKLQTELTPARGHYSQLQKLSAEPQASGAALDKLTFHYDAAKAERRLSLKPYYLKQVSPEAFQLPDPPANSSAQTRAELNYLLALQAQRTHQDEVNSLYKANIYYNPRVTPADSTYAHFRNNLFYIGRSLGTWFNPETLPLTADFMAHVWQDASYFIWTFKYKYLRVRPYKLDSAIKNLEETDWAAYPSGHSANSYVNAFIYQTLAPAFADVFLKDAYDMAHSREIIGVHYPSDSEVSRMLARQLVNKLFENREFLKDFEAVKQEWAANAQESFVVPKLASEKKKAACAKTCD